MIIDFWTQFQSIFGKLERGKAAADYRFQDVVSERSGQVGKGEVRCRAVEYRFQEVVSDYPGQGGRGEIFTINNGMKPRVDKLENGFMFRMNTKEGG
jgi:hypothetical protein